MRYVVERRNGNSAILEMQADGAYKVIAFSAGEDNFDAVMTMVQRANNAQVASNFVR